MKKITPFVFILIFVFIVLGVLLYFSGQQERTGTPTASPSPVVPLPQPSPLVSNERTKGPINQNSIFVPTTDPGTTVNVAELELIDSGYAIIHETSDGITPGGIVGTSALLPKGESRGITITTSRPLKDGELFFAMLHIDDGDGVFDSGKDKPALYSDGRIAMKKFPVYADLAAEELINPNIQLDFGGF